MVPSKSINGNSVSPLPVQVGEHQLCGGFHACGCRLLLGEGGAQDLSSLVAHLDMARLGLCARLSSHLTPSWNEVSVRPVVPKRSSGATSQPAFTCAPSSHGCSVIVLIITYLYGHDILRALLCIRVHLTDPQKPLAFY